MKGPSPLGSSAKAHCNLNQVATTLSILRGGASGRVTAPAAQRSTRRTAADDVHPRAKQQRSSRRKQHGRDVGPQERTQVRETARCLPLMMDSGRVHARDNTHARAPIKTTPGRTPPQQKPRSPPPAAAPTPQRRRRRRHHHQQQPPAGSPPRRSPIPRGSPTRPLSSSTRSPAATSARTARRPCSPAAASPGRPATGGSTTHGSTTAGATAWRAPTRGSRCRRSGGASRT